MLAAAFLTSTLTQGLLHGAMIWALREVLLRLERAGGADHAVLQLGAAAVFVIWLIRSASVAVAQTVSARLAHRVEIDWMYRALEKLLSLSVRFFDRSSQGDLVMASYHDLRGVRTVTQQLAQLALYLSQLVGLLAVAWLISPGLAIIGLVWVPLGATPVYWLGQQVTGAAEREREQVVTLYDSFLQVSAGLRVIKVAGAERRVLERARAVGQALRRHLVRQAHAKALARFALEGVAGLGLIVVLVLGGQDVANGRMEWQSLLALLLAVMAVYTPVVGLLQLYGSVRSVIPNVDRIDAVMRAAPEIRDRAGARRLLEAPREIELRDVSFAYEDQAVLQNISLTVRRAETIGVVGSSGAGKSTLMALLLRFYDPTRGAVLVDGVDLRDVRHADLMSLSGIVLQESFLFVDTVANNIRVGRPEAPIEEVVTAAQAAGVHEEILQMERGYETVIGRGQDARGVSGGQRQRICIAAALLKNAPLLFLDEATNNLDSVAEHKVQRAIDQLMEGRTTFVIAHRLSTLRSATRIIVLDCGRLVGCAPHEELLDGCQTYQQLWASQVGHLTGPRSSQASQEFIDA